MKIIGALLEVQMVRFAILKIEWNVFHDNKQAVKFHDFGLRNFGNIPIILMTNDFRGAPKYRGAESIVNYLYDIPINQIPWQNFNLS